MTDFYLITGFLGAGKTTFLKNFVRLFPGRSLRLIINEFGKEGVDGRLLKELDASLQEISGGSIFCSCRLDKFEEALEEGLEAAPDLLIVEASGLSDPSNIRLILEENEKQGRLKYKGCVCIADAVRLPKVFSTARVCPKQLTVGDIILLNKTDIASKEQLDLSRELILSRLPDAIIKETSFGMVEPAWIQELAPYRRQNDPQASKADISTQRAAVRVDRGMSPYELKRFIAMFAEETSRIKGFVYLDDGGWYLADCVGAIIRLEPFKGDTPEESCLNVLATAGMALRKSLKQAAQWYNEQVTVIFG